MKCPECGFEAYEDMFEDRDGSLNCPQCRADLIIVLLKRQEGGECMSDVDKFVRAWGEVCGLVNSIIEEHANNEEWQDSVDRLQNWLDKNEDPTQFMV